MHGVNLCLRSFAAIVIRYVSNAAAWCWKRQSSGNKACSEPSQRWHVLPPLSSRFAYFDFFPCGHFHPQHNAILSARVLRQHLKRLRVALRRCCWHRKANSYDWLWPYVALVIRLHRCSEWHYSDILSRVFLFGSHQAVKQMMCLFSSLISPQPAL